MPILKNTTNELSLKEALKLMDICIVSVVY